jgi:hypothetical protein
MGFKATTSTVAASVSSLYSWLFVSKRLSPLVRHGPLWECFHGLWPQLFGVYGIGLVQAWHGEPGIRIGVWEPSITCESCFFSLLLRNITRFCFTLFLIS